MFNNVPVGRRTLLGAAVAATAVDPASAQDEPNKWALGKVTPGTDSGPYYPLANKPPRPGADLAPLRDGVTSARGRALILAGQVLDIKGKPIRGVQVEIWQANGAGRYNHPSDGNPAPLDPNFDGYGLVTTDAEGRYQFNTIIPGAYPVSATWWRPPHIHFQLTGRRDRQITQMWFPDETLNEQDHTLGNYPAPVRHLLVCALEPPPAGMPPDARLARFDLILPNG